MKDFSENLTSEFNIKIFFLISPILFSPNIRRSCLEAPLILGVSPLILGVYTPNFRGDSPKIRGDTPKIRGASRHQHRIFGEKSIGEIKKNIFILNSDVKFSEKFLNKKLLTF